MKEEDVEKAYDDAAREAPTMTAVFMCMLVVVAVDLFALVGVNSVPMGGYQGTSDADSLPKNSENGGLEADLSAW